MIEVRLRHVDDAAAVHLCWWEPTDPDGVIQMLASEGLRDSEGVQYAAPDSFTGEFVYEDGAAFYEVVFGSSK